MDLDGRRTLLEYLPGTNHLLSLHQHREKSASFAVYDTNQFQLKYVFQEIVGGIFFGSVFVIKQLSKL